MPNHETNISRAQYVFDFNPVHGGQNFLRIATLRLKIRLNPTFIIVHYKVKVARFDLEMTLEDAFSYSQYKIAILPASYCFITSRTDAAEPQPVYFDPMQEAA